MIFETGPQLVYAVGPDGMFTVQLYPAQSELGSAIEDVIFLGIGRYTGGQLHSRFVSDLRTLAAYGHATSLDGSPNAWEQLVFWKLRTLHPNSTGGKFSQGVFGLHQVAPVSLFAVRTIFTAVITSILRPAAIILVVWFVLKRMPDLAAHLPKGFTFP